MLIEHRGQTPSVHDSAYVAPTAVLCGDVVVGPGSRVLHGAVLTAEDGQVRIGRDVVIMENAVVKGRAGHPAVIGDFVLVGPHAHVNGADVRAGAFIATGASLFPGSVIGNGAEIRVNGVVQVNTTVEPGSVVPIGWVAVGTPATVRAPDQHRDIWAVQRDLDFPGTVYGVPRGSSMRVIMASQSEFYGAHVDDVVVGAEPTADPVAGVQADVETVEESPVYESPADVEILEPAAAESFESQHVDPIDAAEQPESVEQTEPVEQTESVERPDSLAETESVEHAGTSSDEADSIADLDADLDLAVPRDTEDVDLDGDLHSDLVEDADAALTPEPDPAR